METPTVRSSVYSWLLVAAWMASIYAAVPCARAIQRAVENTWGGWVFGTVTATLGMLCLALAVVRVLRCDRRRIRRRLGTLALVLALAAWILLRQLQSAAEAVHFAEYGLLAYLLFRAWRSAIGDLLIYPICILSVALAAWSDEFLQWLVPGRIWDFRDVRLNVLASVVVLVFIAGVAAPAEIRSLIARRSVRWFCRLAWALLLALGLSLSATPVRVDGLAARIPGLGILRNNESPMSEYGHRFIDPEIGVFFSRLDPATLRQLDEARGAAAGERIARERALADHRKFLDSFTRSADPYLQELTWHLVYRKHFYETAWQYRDVDPQRLAWHCAVALGENRILEKYFPAGLDAAGLRWPEVRRAQCAACVAGSEPFVSEVGEHLIVAAPEIAWQLALLALAGGVGWLYLRCGRATRPKAISTTPA